MSLIASNICFSNDNDLPLPTPTELALGVGSNVYEHSILSSTNLDTNKDTVSEEDYQRVADKMFKLKQALMGTYELADEITLGLYILRYLTDLGTFSVGNEEISQLIKSLESLNGEEFDPDFKELLKGIKRVLFSERRGVKYVKIYTKSDKGIVVPLNRTMAEGSVKEIKYLKIKDKTTIYFNDIDSKKEKNKFKSFIKTKARYFFVAHAALNQIHPQIKSNIDNYVLRENQVPPLRMKIKGVYVRVNTSTIFGQMDFFLKELYSLPGFSNGEAGLPSLVGLAKDGLIKIKISLDQ